jgi:hypothetical protein
MIKTMTTVIKDIGLYERHVQEYFQSKRYTVIFWQVMFFIGISFCCLLIYLLRYLLYYI